MRNPWGCDVLGFHTQDNGEHPPHPHEDSKVAQQVSSLGNAHIHLLYGFEEEDSVEVEEPKCWGKTSTRLGAYPCQKRSDQHGVQLNLLVGRPVQYGLLGDDVQPGHLVDADPHTGLVEDEQVLQVLLEVDVQQGFLVVDGAGQALAATGVLLQGSLLAHLVILS